MKNGTAKLENTFDALRDKVGYFKDRVIDLEHRAQKQSGKAFERGIGLVKKHPIAAVAIAFGVGYIAMRLVRR